MPKSRNGEGSIRPRKTAAGTVYDVQLTVKDRTTGLARRIFKGGFPTEKAAVAWRNKTMHESATRGMVREKPITVPQVVEAWIESRSQRAPTTRGLYERTLRNHIKPRLNVRVSALTPKMLKEFAAGTAGAIAKHGKDGEGTNRTALTMVKSALRWAARHDISMIAFNPLQDVPLDMVKPAERGEPMPLEDVSALLAAADGQPSEIAWRLLLETGARRGEITGLNWGDINFRTGVVTIRKIASPESGGRNTDTRTKGKAKREVPLSPALLAILAELKLVREASVFDPVILNSRGTRRATFSAIRYWWERDCAAAGLVGYTPHSLRHTFATTALEAGVPINVVSSILGHASTAVTTEIYAHVTGEMQRKAIMAVTSEVTKVSNAIAKFVAKKPGSLNLPPASSLG
jgi:integrase